MDRYPYKSKKLIVGGCGPKRTRRQHEPQIFPHPQLRYPSPQRVPKNPISRKGHILNLTQTKRKINVELESTDLKSIVRNAVREEFVQNERKSPQNLLAFRAERNEGLGILDQDGNLQEAHGLLERSPYFAPIQVPQEIPKVKIAKKAKKGISLLTKSENFKEWIKFIVHRRKYPSYKRRSQSHSQVRTSQSHSHRRSVQDVESPKKNILGLLHQQGREKSVKKKESQHCSPFFQVVSPIPTNSEKIPIPETNNNVTRTKSQSEAGVEKANISPFFSSLHRSSSSSSFNLCTTLDTETESYDELFSSKRLRIDIGTGDSILFSSNFKQTQDKLNPEKSREIEKERKKVTFASPPVKNFFSASQSYHSTSQQMTFNKEDFSYFKSIAQVDKKFVLSLYQKEEKAILCAFDPHAVHERLRLDKLMKDLTNPNGSIVSIKLQRPVMVKLEQMKVFFLSANVRKFKLFGLEFEIENEFTVAIYSIPMCFKEKAEKIVREERIEVLQTLIKSLINDLCESFVCNTGQALIQNLPSTTGTIPKTIVETLALEACRGAIKFGEEISLESFDKLIQDLESSQTPFQCAHGRPSLQPILNLSKSHLTSYFDPSMRTSYTRRREVTLTSSIKKKETSPYFPFIPKEETEWDPFF